MGFFVKNSLPEEQRKFVGNFMKVVHVLAAISTSLFLAVFMLAYTGKINLTPKHIPLDTVKDRLVFTLKHQSLHLFWILLSIYNVMRHRKGTPAVDPTKGYEHVVQTSKNILTNTIEHGLVFMLSQMILAIDLEPEMCARLIPVLNLQYLVGRIAFSCGYPTYRTFGFLTAHLPIVYCAGRNLKSLYRVYF